MEDGARRQGNDTVNNSIDHLVMLLSTDWFKGHWGVIGIHLNERTTAPIREVCREIVGRIMSGAKEYWLTNFSDERKQETRLMLEGLVEKLGLDQVMAGPIRDWSDLSNEDLDAGALFATLTEEMLSQEIAEHGPDVDGAIKSIVARAWDAAPCISVDFEELCLDSKTDWDIYVRGLTPELPTALSDKLICFLRARAFRVLWLSIRELLTPSQREQLLIWYQVMGRSRAGWGVVPSYLG